MRSGLIYADYGVLRYVGIGGDGWSKMGLSDLRRAYYFYFGSSGVNPSDNGDRYYALPVLIELVKPLQVQSDFSSVKSTDLELY